MYVSLANEDESSATKLYLSNPGTTGFPESEITYHPLDPLTSSEIRLATFIIKAINGTSQWIYKSITLKEPPKAELLQSFLKNDDISVGAAGKVDRKAWVLLVDPQTYDSYEIVLNLNKITLESWKPSKKGAKPPIITSEDVVLAGDIALTNPDIARRIKATGYNLSQVVCDTWESGYVADNPNYATSKHLLQVYFYGAEFSGDNIYAHPLDFVAYVDTVTKTVRGIESLPVQNGSGKDQHIGNSIPRTSVNYFPYLRPPQTSSKMSVLHPIKITQPNGPSFDLHGHQLTWQNFVMRIGNNEREGVVLYHVKYNDNGNVRPLLYRMSLSEILVTYGDPTPPYHRKQSFDMGEFRLGFSSSDLAANNLCPGNAQYLDMVYHNERGESHRIENAICIYEEDSGVLWTHKDWTQGETATARSQRLSISFLATVGHSDYWISWRFYQDATIELKVKLTGVRNTNLMGSEVKAPAYGNIMSPQVFTSINQYFFAARIDADIDGVTNTVSVEDIVAMEDDLGSSTNPYGNGITTRETILETFANARTNVSPQKSRTWKIFNPTKKHPLTKGPTAWKLVPNGNYVPLLMKKNSPLRENTLWTDYNLWVTPHIDDQLYASGLWMDNDGLADWAKENLTAGVVQTDVVLYHTFGITNVPAVENWPVSSDKQETTGFILKPNFFFTENPAVNVPMSNKSTLDES
ncbi:Copper amine oxidase 1 [Orchesella cincta]|uniref:Amine oxidase n=1 Tax=Orchesella cincta TaxID=48709 RepID=A0A1D2NKW4_ORCCI|nr:Copper amine oxidase 1 [Orchesella cincta]